MPTIPFALTLGVSPASGPAAGHYHEDLEVWVNSNGPTETADAVEAFTAPSSPTIVYTTTSTYTTNINTVVRTTSPLSYFTTSVPGQTTATGSTTSFC